MRQPRIKIPAASGEAVYHCMSRTVNGEHLFGDVGKEVMRKQLWQIADFCGVQVLTYAFLSNHFHILVLVPQTKPIDDHELLRRFSVLYPKPTRFQTAKLEVVREQLSTNGIEALAWRARMLALMGDVSQFMKLLKQRFTRWFNRSYRRFGTLWSERFKSTLVEPFGNALQAVAAYIDLNSVRAGLADDPLRYRFCGYAEAVSGASRAQAGLIRVTTCRSWAEAQAKYRQWLFGTGSNPRERRHRITAEQLRQVLSEKGQLSLTTLLRCRVRYFTDGAIFGSHAFVCSHLAAYRARTLYRRTEPQSLPSRLSCAEFWVLHHFRGPAVSVTKR